MKNCIQYVFLIAHKGSCTIRGLQGDAKLVVFILASVLVPVTKLPHNLERLPVLAQERPTETLIDAFSP